MTEPTAVNPTVAPSPAAAAPAAATAAPAAPAPAPDPVIPSAFESLPAPSKTLRVGTVPFLNAQPLIWGLKERGHQLIPIAPKDLGKMLKDGQLDVALAPIAASLEDPNLKVLPVAAIASRGAVKSVRILSFEPLKAVEKLFVDDRSKTSVLLSRLILKKWFGVKDLKLQAVEMASFSPVQMKPWEAVLQFGDNALIPAPFGMTVTDLGEEWTFRTGKPFVFAAWMTADASLAKDLEAELTAAKTDGLNHLDDIVNHYPGLWQLKRPEAKAYLQKNIHYGYGEEEKAGQAEFARLLKEEGLLSA